MSESESMKQLAVFEKFDFDSLPKNVIMLNPVNSTHDITMMV